MIYWSLQQVLLTLFCSLHTIRQSVFQIFLVIFSYWRMPATWFWLHNDYVILSNVALTTHNITNMILIISEYIPYMYYAILYFKIGWSFNTVYCSILSMYPIFGILHHTLVLLLYCNVHYIILCVVQMLLLTSMNETPGNLYPALETARRNELNF